MLKNFNNFLNNKYQEKPVYTVYDLLTVTKNIKKKVTPSIHLSNFATITQ